MTTMTITTTPTITTVNTTLLTNPGNRKVHCGNENKGTTPNFERHYSEADARRSVLLEAERIGVCMKGGLGLHKVGGDWCLGDGSTRQLVSYSWPSQPICGDPSR